jgi:hypothetical protein
MVSCSSCGAENQDGVRFCARCGTEMAPGAGSSAGSSWGAGGSTQTPPASAGSPYGGYPPSDPYAVPAPGWQGASASGRAGLFSVGETRDPLMVVLFGFLTCGIYMWFWLYTTSTELKNALGREDINPTMDVVLSIVTCGFYFIYLLYKYPQLMLEMQDRVGKPRNDISMTSLLLGIFGLGIVSVAIIQSELNAIWATARSRG